jgi:[pyruvate, water dikinase]-phosphate phosphotransferase / [pyruvate, water dikinase] kinase
VTEDPVPPASPAAATLSHGWGPANVFFHLHLVSDSTGETLSAMAQAVCAQFEEARPLQHIHPLVRTPRQMERAISEIEAQPGVVLYTMMKNELRERLETECRRLGLPHLSVLDPALAMLGRYLGIGQSQRLGRQHMLDQRYFDRIDALNYTLAHDDGQNVQNLGEADIVLVGVSRTSKTPTCMYLANRGYKAANVPLVPGTALPHELDALDGPRAPLVVGLFASPERVLQVRRNRLLALNAREDTDYTDAASVRDELAAARRLFLLKGWPMIDVSRRAIEETAAAIIALHNHRGETGPVQGPQGGA